MSVHAEILKSLIERLAEKMAQRNKVYDDIIECLKTSEPDWDASLELIIHAKEIEDKIEVIMNEFGDYRSIIEELLNRI